MSLSTRAGTLSAWLKASLDALPRYRLERVLPSHVGVSIDAYDTRLRRRVQLRIYGPEDEPRRALDGARAASRVRHRGVVEVHEAGELGPPGHRSVYVAIEDVSPSSSLRAWLGRAPSRAQVRRVFDALARALAAVHDAGVVHGGLVGTAARVCESGRVVLIEFRGGPASAEDDLRALARLWLQASARWGHPRRDAVLRRAAAPSSPPAFASVEALRQAVEQAEQVPRWPRWAAGALVVAGPLAWWWSVPADTRPGCAAQVQADRARVWDAARAQRLRAGLTRDIENDETGSRAVARVDAYVQRWSEGATAACEAEAPARIACYAEARGELDTILGLLEHADPKLADRAIRTLAHLPEPGACDRRDASAPGSPLTREFGHLEALVRTGRHEAAHEAATRLLSEHPELGDAARARLHRVRVGALVERRDYEAALEEAETTYLLARKAGVLEVQVRVAARMVSIQGYDERNGAEANRWLERAREAAEAPEADPVLAARVDKAESAFAYGAGDYARALTLIDRAIATRRAVLGPEHASVYRLRNNRAAILQTLGRIDESRAEFEALLAYQTQTYGTMNAAVGLTYNNLGSLANNSGRYQDAIAALDRAIEIWLATRGPDYADLGMAYSNLGNAYAQLGRLDDGIRSQEAAQKIWAATYGTDDFRVGLGRNNLAYACLLAGRFEEAHAHALEARRVQDVNGGPDHPDHVYPAANLAIANKELGRLTEARRWADEAVRVVAGLEDTLPGEVVWSRRTEAEVALAEVRADPERTELGPVIQRLSAVCGEMDGLNFALEQRADCRVALARARIEFGLPGAEAAAAEAVALLDAGGAVRDSLRSARAELAARAAAP